MKEEKRPETVDGQLIFRLRDISHVMRALYEGKGSQKRVLIVLEELGGNVTQRELTHRLGIQPGSASEVIAKLETAGCIRRTPSEADRRTVDITLTEKGLALAREAREQRVRRHEEMFACLTPEEKESLLSLLGKICSDWAVRYPEEERRRQGHRGPGHRGHGHHGRED